MWSRKGRSREREKKERFKLIEAKEKWRMIVVARLYVYKTHHIPELKQESRRASHTFVCAHASSALHTAQLVLRLLICSSSKTSLKIRWRRSPTLHVNTLMMLTSCLPLFRIPHTERSNHLDCRKSLLHNVWLLNYRTFYTFDTWLSRALTSLSENWIDTLFLAAL